MTKSRSNDNGRYFEYLIAEQLKDYLSIELSDNAKKDQARDSKKKSFIKEKDINIMLLASIKISSWISNELTINPDMVLDRLPDNPKNKKDFSHSDITISNKTTKFGLSIKYNNESMWHARMYNFFSHMGFSKNQKGVKDFIENTKKHSRICKSSIPPFTIFSKDRKILPKYLDAWKEFAKNMSMNISDFINENSKDREKVITLYKSILGNDVNNYRIMTEGNYLIIQDLSKLKFPKSVVAKVIQKANSHVFYIHIKFDNGLVVEARTKQDSSKMVSEKAQIKIKPDWKVESWGESGMVEKTIKINQESLI